MRREADPLAGIQPFPATSWSLVDCAGSPDGTDCRRALDTLVSRYLPALRARLVIDRGLDPELAADLLQGFVCDKLLEHRLLGSAQRGRGRFRTFLLTALDNYVIDQHRRAAAARRSPGVPPLAFDEGRLGASPSARDVRADAFDGAWARQVIADAVSRMKADCAAGRRDDVWGVFEARVLRPCVDGTPPLPYDQLVARFGFRSPGQASDVLMTAKRMFARTLRAVVGEYAEDDQAVEDEIVELRAILASPGAGDGRLPRI